MVDLSNVKNLSDIEKVEAEVAEKKALMIKAEKEDAVKQVKTLIR